jgi:hypothetical protein
MLKEGRIRSSLPTSDEASNVHTRFATLQLCICKLGLLLNPYRQMGPNIFHSNFGQMTPE